MWRALLLVLFSCAACEPYGPLVMVSLEGEGRAGLSGVSTSATLDGKAGKPLEFPGVTDRFALRLPVGATGALEVDVFGAMTGEPCVPAHGSGSLMLMGQHEASLLVPLSRLPFRPCADPPAAILAVDGRSEKDVWLVGAAGLVLHWDGAAFQRVATGVSANLNGVWAGGAGEVWIVGDGGTVLTGSVSSLSAGRSLGSRVDLYAVHGAGDGRVWIGGAGGAAYRLEGGSFTPHPVSAGLDVNAIWALGAQDAYAVVGNEGAGKLVHYIEGKPDWDLLASTRSPLYGVWAGGRDDVWAVGDKGLILRNGIEVGGGAALPLLKVTAAGPGAIFAVGAEGAVLRLRAGGAEVLQTPSAYRGSRFFGAWTPSGKESVWIAGDQPGVMGEPGSLLRYVP